MESPRSQPRTERRHHAKKAVAKSRPLPQAARGNTEQAREDLTKALAIFERPGTLLEPDKVRKELAELPAPA